VVFTKWHGKGTCLSESLNPLQSEAVVFTSMPTSDVFRVVVRLNPLQSEAVVFTPIGTPAGRHYRERS